MGVGRQVGRATPPQTAQQEPDGQVTGLTRIIGRQSSEPREWGSVIGGLAKGTRGRGGGYQNAKLGGEGGDGDLCA